MTITQPTATFFPADDSSYPHTAAARIFSRKALLQANSTFSLKGLVGKEGSDKPIIINKELGKENGATIDTLMIGKLAGPGVTGNSPLFDGQTSSGEAAKHHNLRTYLNNRRNSVYEVGTMANFLAKRYKYRSKFKTLLGNWMSDQWELDMFEALDQKYGAGVIAAFSAAVASPHENWYYIGAAGSQVQTDWATQLTHEDAAVNSDPITLDTMESLTATAKLLNIKKTTTEFGSGWIFVVHPYVAHELRKDDNFRAVAMTADIRGIGNRMFQDFVGHYAGITILENSRASIQDVADDVYRSYLLGANALSFAWGSNLEWDELFWDFGKQYHAAICQVYGVSRNSFVYDDGNGTPIINQSSLILSSNVTVPTFG
jgi:N4-gp56 family major capsid protein